MISLIDRLKHDLEWAQANEWESPIMLADDIEAAIRALDWYSQYDTFLYIHGIRYEDSCQGAAPCNDCTVVSGEINSNGKWTDCHDDCHAYTTWIKSKGE